jgi:hypothetical protein
MDPATTDIVTGLDGKVGQVWAFAAVTIVAERTTKLINKIALTKFFIVCLSIEAKTPKM